MKVIAGLGMESLTQKVCEELSKKPSKKALRQGPGETPDGNLQSCPGKIEIVRFPCGELRPQILENIRGQTVFLIQSTQNHDNLINLWLTLDALKRSSAKRSIAVIPYLGYSRQERKDRPRVPISAALFAQFIERAGAKAVVTFDLHSQAIQGFFHGPCNHLYGSFVLIPALKKFIAESGYDLERYVVVAPDKGRVELNLFFAEELGIHKFLFCGARRGHDGKKKMIYIDGDLPKDAICIMCDDMVDTAGTLDNATKVLKDKGAEKIIVTATHPVLSGPAIERINIGPIDQIHFTDTIPLDGKNSPKIIVHSIAPVLAETIYRINRNESITSLFDHNHHFQAK